MIIAKQLRLFDGNTSIERSDMNDVSLTKRNVNFSEMKTENVISREMVPF